MFAYIRLSLSVLFLFISLLAIFRAPTNFLWKLSIAVTEYNYIFILVFLIPLFSKWWETKIGIASGVLCFISIILVLSPLIRAQPVINDVKKEFEDARGNRLSPFVWSEYFFGIKVPPVRKETMVYKKDNGIFGELNFYHPISKDKKAPCVIVIHGGGWDGGDKEQLPAINSYLAANGYAVASIEYRLAPKCTFPAPIEDTKDAIAYLKENANNLNIDSSKFVLLGRSAGGQIALLAAYTLHEPSIKGVISFYAPADMVWGYSVPGNPLILDSRLVMEQYLGGTYSQVPDVFKASSPNEFVSRNSPPTLIIHGIKDEMVAYEHSRRLNNLLEQARVKHHLVTLPWATHGCDYNFNGPSGQISTFAVDRFLNEILR